METGGFPPVLMAYGLWPMVSGQWVIGKGALQGDRQLVLCLTSFARVSCFMSHVRPRNGIAMTLHENKSLSSHRLPSIAYILWLSIPRSGSWIQQRVEFFQ